MFRGVDTNCFSETILPACRNLLRPQLIGLRGHPERIRMDNEL